MSSIVPTNPPQISKITDRDINENNPEDQEETYENPNFITTHLYLKPPNPAAAGGLEKEVVLRRIRQRKRMNRVRTAVKALFGSPFAAKPERASVHHKRWVDDAFAAP